MTSQELRNYLTVEVTYRADLFGEMLVEAIEREPTTFISQQALKPQLEASLSALRGGKATGKGMNPQEFAVRMASHALIALTIARMLAIGENRQ